MSDLFPQTTHEYALHRVTRALIEELPQQDQAPLAARAESLVAIAEHYGVPFENLLAWTHARAPEKQWSGAEFRGWCEWYVEMKRAEESIQKGSFE
jgi:hypothetical protein